MKADGSRKHYRQQEARVAVALEPVSGGAYRGRCIAQEAGRCRGGARAPPSSLGELGGPEPSLWAPRLPGQDTGQVARRPPSPCSFARVAPWRRLSDTSGHRRRQFGPRFPEFLTDVTRGHGLAGVCGAGRERRARLPEQGARPASWKQTVTPWWRPRNKPWDATRRHWSRSGRCSRAGDRWARDSQRGHGGSSMAASSVPFPTPSVAASSTSVPPWPLPQPRVEGVPRGHSTELTWVPRGHSTGSGQVRDSQVRLLKCRRTELPVDPTQEATSPGLVAFVFRPTRTIWAQTQNLTQRRATSRAELGRRDVPSRQ